MGWVVGQEGEGTSSAGECSAGGRCQADLFPFLPMPLRDRVPGRIVRRGGAAGRRCRGYMGIMIRCVGRRLKRRVSLGSLTGISGFSPFCFRQVVGTFLNRPVNAFVIQAQARTTTHLLHCSSVPVTSVTCHVKCSSPSSLSGMFERFCKVSPLRCQGGGGFMVVGPTVVEPRLRLGDRVGGMPTEGIVCVHLSNSCGLGSCNNA